MILLNDEFVRKDVHDAQIDALHKRIDDLHKRIDDLKAEINNVRDSVIRGWSIVGVILTLGAFVFTAVQFYMAVKGGQVH